MTEHDWEHFAKVNNMSPKEFRDEILQTALAVGVVMMERDGSNVMIFKQGNYELVVRDRDA